PASPAASAPAPAAPPREPGTAIMAVSAPPPPLPASALAPLETDPERRKVKHRYRKGFMLTLAFGQSVGTASGYPNDVQKIGVPAYFASSGALLGGGFQMVIGGALTDYFNFGVLFGGGGFKSDDWEVAAGGTGFRVEAFPAVVAFPKIQGLAHLGIAADLGVGNVKIQAKANPDNPAEVASATRGYTTIEGFQSALGIGLFYETSLFSLLGGHVSLAPELSYRTAYTASSQVNYGTLAARLTYYGGP
ncbi:MAG TPA: hypothetical protein PLR99_32615, partial [Polyangiaceae bacterium]|nr:hypothetical protein [Polyangiaceae bacterium]